MSHFTTVKTQIVDVNRLVTALADVGFDEVEVHEVAQHLVGYQGDTRQQTGEVIVRRRHIGAVSNDIGFKRNQEGVFDAIISEYDRARFNASWVGRLTQRYAYHVTKDQIESQDFTIVEETVEQNQTIHISVRRMV